MFSGVADAVDLDHAGPGQPAAAAKEVDAVLGEPTLLAGVGIVRNHEVAPGKHRLDIDLRRPCRVIGAPRRLSGPE